jgi:ABC-type multidrug transport system ATPase subunit
MESDVSNEFNRIASSNLNKLSNEEPLIVQNIVRRFEKKEKETGACCVPRFVSKIIKLCTNRSDGDFIAVNHLSFGVQRKECFGLLGLNGAGKT